MKKYLSIALYSVLILSSTFTYAQTTTPTTTNREYTVLAPLPGTTKNCTGDSCTADLNSYLSGFLGLAIGVGAMISMLILAYYGFQYALSDSSSLKMEYKNKIWDILGGFFLIISAYAIVRTINPKILPVDGFVIDINTPFNQGTSSTVTTGSSTSHNGQRTNSPSGTYVNNGVYYNDCTNCASLQSFNIAGSGSVNSSFGEKLKKLQSSFNGFRSTEAWPPTRNHRDECHKNGTCIDAVLSAGYSANNIVAFATAARNAGVRAVFEITNETEALRIKEAFRNAGLPENWVLRLPQCSGINPPPGGCITGTHFSVYNN